MTQVKKIKPTLSEGTRDFLPLEISRRNYIFETIKKVFRKYGFEEIQTPALEKLEVLQGKYGEEGDKLLFKIRGNKNLYDSLSEDLKSSLLKEYPYRFIPKASDKGLRYDHTVPLARFVVQHQDDLTFPFKRFVVGPVWRGDRPQNGRYQEFYQFDADVIGSISLLNEVELTMIYAEVFKLLNIPVRIKISNRKILQGIASFYNCLHRFEEFTGAIDKIDKIGYQKVVEELANKGINVEPQNNYPLSFFWTGAQQNSDSWLTLKNWFVDLFSRTNFNVGIEGIEELYSVVKHFDFNSSVQFDCSLARGLDYYTGTVWEIALNDERVSIGSLGGGGRYDNLTEIFGGQNMTGVGISFGVERLYIVMEELNLFPETLSEGVKVLFVPRDSEVEEFAFNQVKALREAGISAEIFLGNVKKQKHFAYAEQKGITYMVEVGANEMGSQTFRLRHIKERREEGNGFTLEGLKQKLA